MMYAAAAASLHFLAIMHIYKSSPPQPNQSFLYTLAVYRYPSIYKLVLTLATKKQDRELAPQQKQTYRQKMNHPQKPALIHRFLDEFNDTCREAFKRKYSMWESERVDTTCQISQENRPLIRQVQCTQRKRKRSSLYGLVVNGTMYVCRYLNVVPPYVRKQISYLLVVKDKKSQVQKEETDLSYYGMTSTPTHHHPRRLAWSCMHRCKRGTVVLKVRDQKFGSLFI